MAFTRQTETRLNMDDQLQVHIPSFVYSSVPTLVPGGGAEVVPIADQDWFVNTGFTPSIPHEYQYCLLSSGLRTVLK